MPGIFVSHNYYQGENVAAFFSQISGLEHALAAFGVPWLRVHARNAWKALLTKTKVVLEAGKLKPLPAFLTLMPSWNLVPMVGASIAFSRSAHARAWVLLRMVHPRLELKSSIHTRHVSIRVVTSPPFWFLECTRFDLVRSGCLAPKRASFWGQFGKRGQFSVRQWLSPPCDRRTSRNPLDSSWANCSKRSKCQAVERGSRTKAFGR